MAGFGVAFGIALPAVSNMVGRMDMISAFPQARPRLDWRSFWLVLALAFVGAASFQGSRGLYETTEGRYAECARETMVAGDFDDPILNGQPHWSKPPLTYVAIMAGTRVLGNNPWGVRAYLVVAMVFASGAIWLAGRSIWGAGAGLWAGMVFATSPIVAGAANVASADMLTTLWAAMALAAFWRGFARRSPISLLATWIFLGLGLLTKGPPALLVPAVTLSVAAYVLLKNGTWRIGGQMFGLGLGLFLALGAGWYVSEAEHTPGLFSYWIGTELIERNVSDVMQRNPGFRYAFSMYLPILMLGTGPWLPLALWRGRPLKAWLHDEEDRSVWSRAVRLSLLAGVAVPFAVFSLSRSKLPLYLVPLFVPLSLVLGRMIEVLIVQGRLRARMAYGWAGFLLALIVACKGASALVDNPSDMTRLAAALAPALDREKSLQLYTVAGHPQNGLEFHLGRLIEPVPSESLFQHMRKGAIEGRDAGYLIKRKNWVRLSPQAPGRVREEPLGKHWLLIRPEAGEW